MSRRGSARAVAKLGKRRLKRDAHRDVTRIVELSEEGYSPAVIAGSVGLTEGFVREVLERAEEVRKGEDAPAV